MVRIFVGSVCGLALSVASWSALGGSLLKRTAAELRRSGAELDKIEGREGAEVAAGEIALARRWIEEGFALLGRGRERRAAKLAERLPVQLRLIRTILAARQVEEQAESAERKIHADAERLILLRARYDRLLIKHRGAAATNAYPRYGGGE